MYILLSARRRAYFSKSIAIEMGGVARYFSKVSGSGVDLALLRESAGEKLLGSRTGLKHFRGRFGAFLFIYLLLEARKP